MATTINLSGSVDVDYGQIVSNPNSLSAEVRISKDGSTRSIAASCSVEGTNAICSGVSIADAPQAVLDAMAALRTAVAAWLDSEITADMVK